MRLISETGRVSVNFDNVTIAVFGMKQGAAVFAETLNGEHSCVLGTYDNEEEALTKVDIIHTCYAQGEKICDLRKFQKEK